MKEIIKLWQHQRDIIARAKDAKGYAIFAEQGTGKTATAINILRHRFYEAGRVMRTLIFCPPVVRTQWKQEFAAHSKCAKDVVVLEGAGKKRYCHFKEKAFPDVFGRVESLPNDKIFVTNYESLLMKDLFKEFKEWKPEILIFDESHKIKSHQSKRTKLAIELSDIAQYKYLLTGTPILNTPSDIWSQFRVLDGGATFDENFFAFKHRFFYDRNAGFKGKKQYFPDWQPRPGIEPIFNEKIYKKASRVLKKDCLDLPPMVYQTLTVEMAPDQKKMYKDMEKDFVAYLEDKACVASIALTKALRMQQIASGYFIDDEGTPHQFKKNPRLEELLKTVEDIAATGAKIIIWACFKQNYFDLQYMLKDKYKVVHLLGGMSDKARQEAIDDFQKGDAQIIIANQQAGGVGVNLTQASFAIYYSCNFSLEADLQSEARCHRGGSEIHDKITRIDLVAKDTIDEVILSALKRKENLASNILTLKGLL